MNAPTSPAYVARYIAPNLYAVVKSRYAVVKSRPDMPVMFVHHTLASAVEHAAALNKQQVIA